MRRRLVGVIALLMFMGTAGATAFGWGADGHRAIALVAQKRLHAHAMAEIQRLLENESLETVSTWADELRSARRHKGPAGNDLDASRFNQFFPKNGTWHYMNLPLGGAAYDPELLGARTDDPVHVMVACIDVLRGRKPEGYEDMGDKQALKWLVHLAGDIHQPLHVGCGYYAEADNNGSCALVRDPRLVEGLANDKGGNALQLVDDRDSGGGGRTNFHKYWDTHLVRSIGHGPSDVVDSVESQSSDARWQPGFWEALLVRSCPEAWATDTLHLAGQAYDKLGQASFRQDGKDWLAHPDLQQYEEWGTHQASAQLYKAGARLAFLLNSIWP